MGSQDTGSNISATSDTTDTIPITAYYNSAHVVSFNALLIYEKYVSSVVSFSLSLMGLTTNTVNIVVYWRQGYRDAVNITFIALSLWDLMNCFLSCCTRLCLTLDNFVITPTVNIASFQYVYIGYTRGFTYALSILVTVYLTLERCLCVMLPLKMKDTFTARHAILVNLIIVWFGLVCFCPAWATQAMHWEFNPVTNRSRLEAWLSASRRDIDLFTDTFNGIVIPAIAQLIITICGGFMIQGIRKSSRFRQKGSNSRKSEKYFNPSDGHTASPTPNSVKRAYVMTNKERKLTKVVILLAAIFFSCNMPVFIVAVLRAVLPELDIGRQLYILYRVLYSAIYQFGLINSAVNIFVYYNVSSRFRKEFLALLHRAV